MAGIEAWLAAGIRRVILGSAAVKNPALVREACRAFPGRIVVGIDARDGTVATEGWAETSAIDARDLALSFEDAGVAAIVYTDIGRDGMLSGLNLEQTVALARAVDHAGDRLGRRRRPAGPDRAPTAPPPARRIEGVIVGRALYDGRIDPARRWRCCRLTDQIRTNRRSSGSRAARHDLVICACIAHGTSF